MLGNELIDVLVELVFIDERIEEDTSTETDRGTEEEQQCSL